MKTREKFEEEFVKNVHGWRCSSKEREQGLQNWVDELKEGARKMEALERQKIEREDNASRDIQRWGPCARGSGSR